MTDTPAIVIILALILAVALLILGHPWGALAAFAGACLIPDTER